MKTYFIYPSGNATILVDNVDQKIQREDYSSIAATLLQANQGFEQVGFIEKGNQCEYRCHMMGGEFCINALRSLALLINEQFGKSTFELESSGTKHIFTMEIEQWVCINLEKNYKKREIKNNIFLVELEGIAHFIQTIKKSEWSEQLSKEQLRSMQKEYPLVFEDNPAVGLVLVDEFNTIYPLIYVKDTNTVIFESACGSGTLAAFIAYNKYSNCFMQPSGYPYFIEEKEGVFVLKSNVRMLPI